jgi:hypothetical protein
MLFVLAQAGRPIGSRSDAFINAMVEYRVLIMQLLQTELHQPPGFSLQRTGRLLGPCCSLLESWRSPHSGNELTQVQSTAAGEC